MASTVRLCNIALARLGAARITSLTDNTSEAKLCNTLFDVVAEEVMSEGMWTSTINRATLNRTTNTPAFGYTYEFQLPTSPKALKVLSINEDTTGTYGFRIEGDKLLANVSTMKIQYIGKIEDTESYDPMLQKAIVSRLTAELAYPITGSSAVSERWWAKYEQDVADGLANNGQQGSNLYIASTDLNEIR